MIKNNNSISMSEFIVHSRSHMKDDSTGSQKFLQPNKILFGEVIDLKENGVISIKLDSGQIFSVKGDGRLNLGDKITFKFFDNKITIQDNISQSNHHNSNIQNKITKNSVLINVIPIEKGSEIQGKILFNESLLSEINLFNQDEKDFLQNLKPSMSLIFKVEDIIDKNQLPKNLVDAKAALKFFDLYLKNNNEILEFTAEYFFNDRKDDHVIKTPFGLLQFPKSTLFPKGKIITLSLLLKSIASANNYANEKIDTIYNLINIVQYNSEFLRFLTRLPILSSSNLLDLIFKNQIKLRSGDNEVEKFEDFKGSIIKNYLLKEQVFQPIAQKESIIALFSIFENINKIINSENSENKWMHVITPILIGEEKKSVIIFVKKNDNEKFFIVNYESKSIGEVQLKIILTSDLDDDLQIEKIEAKIYFKEEIDKKLEEKLYQLFHTNLSLFNIDGDIKFEVVDVFLYNPSNEIIVNNFSLGKKIII